MLSYRRELDGLRALAVIAVIVYHANLKTFGVQIFQGGFFGVDVFFVLSGYLITGIIRDQMDKGTFSFRDFYWRRTKRIVPALLSMLVVTSGIAYVVLLPNDLITYVNSLKSALYFGSNYFFYSEDSYVADASIYKPLLHTWSLAVEWQFYIIYPIIVWVANRFFHQYLFEIILGITLLSLQFSTFIVSNYPDMAFYLLPSRAWELTMGGLATFYSRERFNSAEKGSLENLCYKALPLLGLFLIMHSMLFIGHEVQHPSFLTLMPVIGTCLYLMFAHKGEASSDILSIKPIVYVGLVSYSLYLWHQPIFVFFRFIKNSHFRYEQFALLLVVSLSMAALTCKFVENIYRKRAQNKYVYSLPLLAAFSLVFFSQQTLKNEGFPERLKGNVKEAYEMYKVVEFRRLEKPTELGDSYRGAFKARSQCNFRTVDTACRFGDESWVTIGDSYVGQYDFALNEITKANHEGMISLAYEQCPFVSPSIWFGNVPECTIVNEDRLNFISNLGKTKKFIVAANYFQFDVPKVRTENPIEDGKKNFSGGNVLNTDIAWKSYANNINKLLEAGHEVYVVYSVPPPGLDVKKTVFQQLTSSVSKYKDTWSTDKNSFVTANNWSKKLDSYLPNHPNLHKIRPADIFCQDKRCKVIDASGGLYNSSSHLSYAGAKKVLDKIFKNAEVNGT